MQSNLDMVEYSVNQKLHTTCYNCAIQMQPTHQIKHVLWAMERFIGVLLNDIVWINDLDWGG